ADQGVGNAQLPDPLGHLPGVVPDRPQPGLAEYLLVLRVRTGFVQLVVHDQGGAEPHLVQPADEVHLAQGPLHPCPQVRRPAPARPVGGLAPARPAPRPPAPPAAAPPPCPGRPPPPRSAQPAAGPGPAAGPPSWRRPPAPPPAPRPPPRWPAAGAARPTAGP